jgi:dihydropteroate synthase
MGVVNVTPDSFSDGGETPTAELAVARGFAMLEEGADILDVGGESTRPGADPVSVEVEVGRVLPVVGALARAGAVVSVDTRHALVMRAALDHGASIVNDVTALTGDVQCLPTVARAQASAILMHMQGEPQTMQRAPSYGDAAGEVFAWLSDRVAACREAGMPLERIAVDPGIGFGKTLEHNLHILSRLHVYRSLGCALVVGVSRKSFIGRLARGEPPRERMPGSLAAALAAVHGGAQILRVHDVAATRQALAVWEAIAGAGRTE